MRQLRAVGSTGKVDSPRVIIFRAARDAAVRAARGRRGGKRRKQVGMADAVAFERMALGMGLERARHELDSLERGLAQLIGS